MQQDDDKKNNNEVRSTKQTVQERKKGNNILRGRVLLYDKNKNAKTKKENTIRQEYTKILDKIMDQPRRGTHYLHTYVYVVHIIFFVVG